MRVNKFLAVFTAIILITAAIPVSASASSTNSMEKNITVMPDSCFSNTFQMVLNGPVNDPGQQKFTLSIENGKFAEFTANGSREDNNLASDSTALTYGLYNKVPVSAEGEFNSNVANATINNTSVVFAFFHDGNEVTDEYLELGAVRLNENSARISMTMKKSLVDGDTMVVYLNLRSDSDSAGNVILKLDGEDSIFSDFNQTSGNVATDRTKAVVTGKIESFGRSYNVKGARVEIEEVSSNSITGNQIIRFILPKGMEWSEKTVLGGSMLESSLRDKSLKDVWRMDGQYDDTGEYSIKGNVLNIHMKYDGSSSSRDILYIDPVFDIGKDAEKGGIRLEIKSLKAWGNPIDDVIAGKIGDCEGGSVTSNQPAPIIPDPAAGRAKAVFKIGEASYNFNGNVRIMDANPFIDANNRTMVPIRYVANALEIGDEGISYDTNSRTATIVNAVSKRTVRITTGEKMLAVSNNEGTLQAANAVISMDTVAVNKGGRIYVPARYIVEAFGAEIVWNPTEKTVEILS